MIRFFLSLGSQDLFSKTQSYFSDRKSVKSVLSVPFPSDTISKLDRMGTNVLLWDLDKHKYDPKFKSLINRYSLYIIYTSANKESLHSHIGPGPVREYAQKPETNTHASMVRYLATIEKHIREFSASSRPTPMRELVKLVNVSDKQKIVAIASSTGGTNALEEIIKRLPEEMPPIVVVQHMPSGFTKLFAERLNSTYPQEIREAQSGDFLMRGLMLLAPADRHMRVVVKQGRLAVECFVGNRIHGVMPAADVLFESIAGTVKGNAVGVVLTGMGSDGAKGLLQMKAVGCKNIGQNKETCVVYGMPKAAMDIGAIHYELPIESIADMIVHLAKV